MKKIVVKMFVVSMFLGSLLSGSTEKDHLGTISLSAQSKETWKTIDTESKTKKTPKEKSVVYDEWLIQESNLGRNRKIRSGHDVFKQCKNLEETFSCSYKEFWNYNSEGKPVKKIIEPPGNKYENGKIVEIVHKWEEYKWSKPGVGKPYLTSKHQFVVGAKYATDTPNEDIYYNPNGTRKYMESYSSDGNSYTKTTYTKGKVTKRETEYKYENKELEYSKKKTKSKKIDIYYSNGKSIKESKITNYNKLGKKTKHTINSFHSNGKKKLARDTYYYENGATRKELKENQYDSKGKKTKNVLNQWYSNGKPKIYKDTYYKSNGKVKEIKQSTFSKTGKKTSTIKKY